jgi:putative DNA primase/helicase
MGAGASARWRKPVPLVREERNDMPIPDDPEPSFVEQVPEALAPSNRPTTDAGNAECFADMYGSLVRFDHSRRRWLLWNSHRWLPDADAAVRRMALNMVRKRYEQGSDDSLDSRDRVRIAKWAIHSEAKSRMDALLGVAQSLLPIAHSGVGWDEAKGLIGVGNGVVDLRTGELRNGKQSDLITMSTGVDYDPNAVCPRWDRFLLEVLEEEETSRFLQLLVGYSLTAEALSDMLIFLMGVGRNGKNTYLEALALALGDYMRSISGQAFSAGRRNAHTTELADMELSRLAYCEELGGGVLNTERLKEVSGSASTRARRMREDSRVLKRTWQLWFTTNDKPRSDDNTWGFWSRVVVVDFPRQFTDDDDPELEATLASEAQGILAWAVRGAVRYYAEGPAALRVRPQSVVAKTAEYREDMDPLTPLFEGGYLVRCEQEVWTPTTFLMNAYHAYAARASVPADRTWSETRLGTELGRQFARKRRQVEVVEEGSSERRRLWGCHGVRAGDPGTTGWTVPSWRFEEGSTEGIPC